MRLRRTKKVIIVLFFIHQWTIFQYRYWIEEKEDFLKLGGGGGGVKKI